MSIAEEIAKRAAESAAQSTDVAQNKDGQVIPSTAADTNVENANQALAASNAGAQSKTNIMDPAALVKGIPVANVKTPTPTVADVRASEADRQEAAAKLQEFRTFKHIYAGAKTHLPNGREIRFGGLAGSPGFYATMREDEIEYLVQLSKMPGSQITEVSKAGSDRSSEFFHDLQEAQAAARANTDRYYDPATTKAVEGLGNAIAADTSSHD